MLTTSHTEHLFVCTD